MSACLWCGYELYYWQGSTFDAKGACVRCGARHEFDGDLNDSGNWVYSAQLVSVGKPELRAEIDTAVDAMLRDVLTRVVQHFDGTDAPLGKDARAALDAIGGKIGPAPAGGGS